MASTPEECERLTAEVEQLRRLDEDKFRQIQGYSQAADEDRAVIADLWAEVEQLRRELAEARVNGNRTAAVPDLLAACQAILRAQAAAEDPEADDLGRSILRDEAVARAKEAVAKAEGRRG